MYSISVFSARIEEYYLYLILAGGKEHTVAIHAAKLSRLQITNEHNLLTYKVVRCIEFSNSGYHLALFVSEINLKLQKLLSLRNGFARNNFCYAKLYHRE